MEHLTGTRIVPDSDSHSLIMRPSSPVPRELRTFGPLPKPYPYDENTPLIWFNERDAWTIDDSFQGCVLMGETGSGKSTAGKHIFRACARRGYGICATTVKITDVANYLQWSAEEGRLADVILVHPEQPWRFNWLAHNYSRVGEGAGETYNAVQAFIEVCSSTSETGTRNNGTDSFWIENAKRLLRNTLDLLVSAELPPSMDRIMGILHGRPLRTPAGELHWPEESLLYECLSRAEQSSYAERHHINLRAIRSYWQTEGAIAGEDRTMAGIIATLTGMADPFLSGPAKELFCSEHPNFEPEWSRYGAIIILALPTLVWHDVGRVSQLLFKYLWQRSVTRRQGLPPGEVPVVLFMDEAQNWLTPFDWRYQAEARSSWSATVALTQTLSGVHATLDPSRAYAQAGAWFSNLSTKVALRNSDATSNQFMSEAIGRDIVHRSSISIGWNEGSNEGDNSSVGITGSEKGSSVNFQDGTNRGYSIGRNEGMSSQETMDHIIPPRVFTLLAPGQAIVYKAGRRWHRTGSTFLDMQFPA
jgi:hypothetical protein